MNCKNCNDRLRLDFQFCPGCGAKVVKNRLTFKGLFEDIMERVFNLENSFYRTLRDLTIRPEAVVLKYVEGTRRRYMAPMNYLAVALAVSGITILAMRRFALDKLDFESIGNGMSSEAGEKMMNAAMEYNSLIFILYIPVIALSGWLIFNKREHNIPEYTVTAVYILSHLSIISFPFSLVTLIAFPEFYLNYSFVFIGIMFAYTVFVMARTHQFKWRGIIGRGILFFFLFSMGYLGVSILLYVFMFITGEITLQDFAPPPEA